MKKSKLLLIMLILPWITVPFLGVNSFKKYLPSALFSCIFTKALDMYGKKNKWWKFYKGIGLLDSMTFFNFGPYLVTSLWMLKTTYGKFPLYLIVNAINHITFTFIGLKLLKRYKIAGSLVKMNKLQYLLLLTFRGLVLYGFQLIIDLKKSNDKV
ncbi:hypothetical protein [Neobacillus kokaensis]|uniref:Uncharacterized protein n=1 Tax=Neobacillus kokaensis TaxID=2759023 RepID=A0ABQ3NCL4_9BACI|nr:hypothetical protein [Neobacillus kokaensis]GHI01643.1 hypothetical protein AM1BK_51850 [Neobacillus kokaensis]